MHTEFELSKRISQLIGESGRNQSDLATALGVTRHMVSNWVNGRQSMSIKYLEPLCRYFGITAEEFLSGGGSGDIKDADNFRNAYARLGRDERKLVDHMLDAATQKTNIAAEDVATQN